MAKTADPFHPNQSCTHQNSSAAADALPRTLLIFQTVSRPISSSSIKQTGARCIQMALKIGKITLTGQHEPTPCHNHMTAA